MNIVDVLSQQNQVQDTKLPQIKPTDYRKTEKSGVALLFLFECSIKLQIKPITAASAAIYYHRFFKEVKITTYDEYLIAASCLYLAGKVNDDLIKIRDIINVAHSTLNRGACPLELGDEYWSMRDAIVQAELLIARILQFDLNIEHPHKFLFYYIKTLQDWMGVNMWKSTPIAKTAASFLQDFHHNPKILNYKATHIAICCLSLALQTYGIQIPLTDESDDTCLWFTPLVADISKEKQWEIIEDIIEVYKQENEIYNT